ncbi:MAG: SCO family protein [Pseudomonadales bacterium]|nr:SCO family protein [Pseudomonadales bacterium]
MSGTMRPPLICGQYSLLSMLLTALLLVPGSWANAQSAAAETAQFERDQALATSQAAIGRQVRDSTFYDSDGQVRRLSDYAGKPLVISLIYTSCFHICPATTKHLAKVVQQARSVLGTDSFSVITLGFDTPNDTPDAMKIFARQQHVEIPDWDFLSTDAQNLEVLAEDLGFLYYPTPHGFDHLIQSTILDRDGVVFRQVYGIQFEVPHLIEPLKVLVFGGSPNDSLLDQLGSRIRLFCTVYDPASDSYKFDYSIFAGLLIGLVMGGFFVYLLIREWRRLHAHNKHAAERPSARI